MDAVQAQAPSSPSLDGLSMKQRMALQYEVEQFLYEEAALLDARRFREWLGLVAEDVHYWMPIRRTVSADNLDREFTKPGDMAFFDDDHVLLETRVKKLESVTAWSENPPSRSRHYVSNVRITGCSGDELTVECCFLLHRTRLDSEPSAWHGRRVDVLRRTETSCRGFHIVRRHLFLDETVIQATNMSTIF